MNTEFSTLEPTKTELSGTESMKMLISVNFPSDCKLSLVPIEYERLLCFILRTFSSSNNPHNQSNSTDTKDSKSIASSPSTPPVQNDLYLGQKIVRVHMDNADIKLCSSSKPFGHSLSEQQFNTNTALLQALCIRLRHLLIDIDISRPELIISGGFASADCPQLFSMQQPFAMNLTFPPSSASDSNPSASVERKAMLKFASSSLQIDYCVHSIGLLFDFLRDFLPRHATLSMIPRLSELQQQSSPIILNDVEYSSQQQQEPSSQTVILSDFKSSSQTVIQLSFEHISCAMLKDSSHFILENFSFNSQQNVLKISFDGLCYYTEDSSIIRDMDASVILSNQVHPHYGHQYRDIQVDLGHSVGQVYLFVDACRYGTLMQDISNFTAGIRAIRGPETTTVITDDSHSSSNAIDDTHTDAQNSGNSSMMISSNLSLNLRNGAKMLLFDQRKSHFATLCTGDLTASLTSYLNGQFAMEIFMQKPLLLGPTTGAMSNSIEGTSSSGMQYLWCKESLACPIILTIKGAPNEALQVLVEVNGANLLVSADYLSKLLTIFTQTTNQVAITQREANESGMACSPTDMSNDSPSVILNVKLNDLLLRIPGKGEFADRGCLLVACPQVNLSKGTLASKDACSPVMSASTILDIPSVKVLFEHPFKSTDSENSSLIQHIHNSSLSHDIQNSSLLPGIQNSSLSHNTSTSTAVSSSHIQLLRDFSVNLTMHPEDGINLNLSKLVLTCSNIDFPLVLGIIRTAMAYTDESDSTTNTSDHSASYTATSTIDQSATQSQQQTVSKCSVHIDRVDCYFVSGTNPVAWFQLEPCNASINGWNIPNALEASCRLGLSAWLYNIKCGAWEPLTEPWTVQLLWQSDCLSVLADDVLDVNICAQYRYWLSSFLDVLKAPARMSNVEASFVNYYTVRNQCGMDVTVSVQASDTFSSSNASNNGDSSSTGTRSASRSSTTSLGHATQSHLIANGQSMPIELHATASTAADYSQFGSVSKVLTLALGPNALWTAQLDTSVLREGTFLYSLTPAVDNVVHVLVIEVSVQAGTKTITLKSSFAIGNATEYDFILRVFTGQQVGTSSTVHESVDAVHESTDTQLSRNNSMTSKQVVYDLELKTGSFVCIPILECRDSTFSLLPKHLSQSHSFCSQAISWRDFESEYETLIMVCKDSQAPQDASKNFYFSLVPHGQDSPVTGNPVGHAKNQQPQHLPNASATAASSSSQPLSHPRSKRQDKSGRKTFHDYPFMTVYLNAPLSICNLLPSDLKCTLHDRTSQNSNVLDLKAGKMTAFHGINLVNHIQMTLKLFNGPEQAPPSNDADEAAVADALGKCCGC